MTYFSEVSNMWLSVIGVLFFILSLAQFYYCFLIIFHRSKKNRWINLLIMLFLFVTVPILAKNIHVTDAFFSNVPFVALWILWIVLCLNVMFGIHYENQIGREMLTNQSVKEAIDTLPAGICFFSDKGYLVLSNTMIQELYWQFKEESLQMIHELDAMIHESADLSKMTNRYEEYICHMPDETVWSFRKKVIVTEAKQKYIQYTAVDITGLYKIRLETERENRELEQMIARVHRITENTADITRQQEILTAKMRVHNKMGNCMLSARQYIVHGCPHTKKQELIDLWKASLRDLKNEIGAEDESNAYEAVVKIAKSIGLEVRLHGQLPKNQQLAYMLVVALRECVTNALYHAKATSLDLSVSISDDYIEAVYTNNGTVPKHEIVEGGGLSSLRKKVEGMGGQMTIGSIPAYELTLHLPTVYQGMMEG